MAVPYRNVFLGVSMRAWRVQKERNRIEVVDLRKWFHEQLEVVSYHLEQLIQ